MDVQYVKLCKTFHIEPIRMATIEWLPYCLYVESLTAIEVIFKVAVYRVVTVTQTLTYYLCSVVLVLRTRSQLNDERPHNS